MVKRSNGRAIQVKQKRGVRKVRGKGRELKQEGKGNRKEKRNRRE